MAMVVELGNVANKKGKYICEVPALETFNGAQLRAHYSSPPRLPCVAGWY